jgi:hypothetical protein
MFRSKVNYRPLIIEIVKGVFRFILTFAVLVFVRSDLVYGRHIISWSIYLLILGAAVGYAGLSTANGCLRAYKKLREPS